MKRLLSLTLALLLALSLCSTALAANNYTCQTSGSLSASFVKYDTLTVKSGAVLTITADSGFEIAGALIVESGAKLICNGACRGDFHFSLCRGCIVEGVDLYYPQEMEGSVSIMKIPVSVKQIWDNNLIDQDALAFQWNTQQNVWCLNRTVRGNPFGIKFYHTQRDMDAALGFSDTLHRLGLFAGVGANADGSINYDLARPATRLEALAMLVRLLGKEEEARSGVWSHPFTDVPNWAQPYVGYAYANGLTAGVSATKFGTGNVTAQQYLTFILRALGYPDNGTELYRNALEKAHQVGLTPDDDPDGYALCMDSFWRADVVAASLRALDAQTVDGVPLWQSLADAGVFPANAFRAPGA